MVLKDLESLPKKRIYDHPDLRIGLKSLCERKYLIIRPADKGGGLVILDKDDYHAEMCRILEDTNTYTPLLSDPTKDDKRELVELVKKGFQQGILDKKERDYLVPVAPHIPIMYYLPKVHKNATQPPGRPIVSGIDSVTSRVGRYKDFHLQPLVQSVPSYLKDTGDTIRRMESINYQCDYLLVTADVIYIYLHTAQVGLGCSGTLFVQQ